MKKATILSVLSTLLCLSYGHDDSYPVGDVRNCPTSQLRGDQSVALLHMDALPGLGFDNLRNIELGQVYNMNYATCKISNDGFYLLPDEIFLVPVLNSEVDFYANIYESFDQWKSTTSESINAEAKISFAHIGGKFSQEYQDTKTKVINSKSTAVRVGLRHHLYSVHVNPDTQLHKTFKHRVMDLAAHIQSNNTELAHYLADLLVRDYGTHIITSVEAGAALYQTTFVSNDFVKNSETSRLTVSASASANFFGVFKLKISGHYSKTTTDVNGFNDHTTHLRTSTHGGPPFKISNFSYADWEKDIQNNLIAIDRRGEPLYTAISTSNLHELPDVLLLETTEYIYKAINRYYKINTHFGCIDPNSPKFDFHANIDDKSCVKDQQNYTFGGVYQTCYNSPSNLQDVDVCSSYGASQTNPLTSDYTCPNGYHSILLHTGTLKKTVPVNHCTKSCFLFFCRKHCAQFNVINYASYNAYWCAFPPGQQVPPDSGYMFGGMYSSKHSNPVTGASTCPPFFYPLHFGEDINVCVSNDAEGTTYSLPFGGFHSCTTGNPLATTSKQFALGNYPKRCPIRYNQLLLAVDQGCIINYCSKIKVLLQYSPQPPILPPYRAKLPTTVNVTNTLTIVGPHGTMWIKSDNGSWTHYKPADKIDDYQYLQSFLTPGSSSNGNVSMETTHMASYSHHDFTVTTPTLIGAIIGTALGAGLCVLVLVMMGHGVNRYHKKRKERKESLAYLDRSVPSETTILVQKIE